MILESITAGYVRCSVEAGEALPITAARRAAAEYRKPVTFDFNKDPFIVHPNGDVHQMTNGRWVARKEFAMPKTIIKCWVFASSSSDKVHETLLYDTGELSCSCPGWCKRTQADGTRTCKHIRLVEMHRADHEAIMSHDYSTGVPAFYSDGALKPKQTTQRKEANAKAKGKPAAGSAGYGKRKLIT